MGLGEGEVREQVSLRLDEQSGDPRETRLQTIDRPPQLLPGGGLVGLLEDGADDGGHHAPCRARYEVLGVAGEVDPAPLPGSAKELLMDSLDESAVIVADDETDT